MDKKWKDKTTFEKVLDIISFVAAVVWLSFEIVDSKTSLAYANAITYIAVCIICICQAISFWKVKRVLSYVAIAGVACTLAGFILELM